jgi:hypothetical protein
MRDFFIRGFEVILGLVLILAVLGVILAAGAVAMGSVPVNGLDVQGPVAGAAILIGGLVYLLFIGGLMYLGLGIYHNTRRTAEATEARSGLRG